MSTQSANPAAAMIPVSDDVAPVDYGHPPTPIDRRFVTAALMLVMVLASMEMTVTSTAMPTIIGDLHGLQHYSWVASIYLLACTVSMPLYGRLADAWGRKRVILGAILIFSVSSLAAAAARSMGQLIVFRGLQGLGAGGVMPVVLTILGDIFTLKERAKIQGFFSIIWGSASLAGPALGAALVRALGWRSIFFVNLPFGLIAILVLIWKYHDQEKPHSTDLDLPGVASLAVACSALLMLVSGLGPQGSRVSVAVPLAAVAVVASIFFIWHERRAANPIMPPALMMRRAIGPSMIASVLFGVCFLGLDTYVPLYVQGGLGGGVEAAARVVTPVMFTWALSSFIAAPLLVRWGFRKTAFTGSVLIAVGFVGLFICTITHANLWAVTGVLAVTGMGFGPASMSYLLAAQDAVAWQQRGIITSSVSFFRTIGGAVGIGVLGAIFNLLIRPDLNRLHHLVDNPLDPKVLAKISPALQADVQRMISHGAIWVFAGMLATALLQIAVTLMMSGKKADHRAGAGEAMEAVG